ncbi:D-3-phosphoglycerate dehydrogenase 2, partial [Haplosporangium sp. Z 27]
MSLQPSSPPSDHPFSTSAPSTTRVMPNNTSSSIIPGADTPTADIRGRERQGSFGGSTKVKILKPFNTANIKILLLENVNETAVSALRAQGYQVETHAKALAEDVLIEKIRDVHCIGIRSKTKLTKKVLDAAEKLGVIGCFCIGTNQVDLEHASQKGVAVFNSPFSNSRSVAELEK